MKKFLVLIFIALSNPAFASTKPAMQITLDHENVQYIDNLRMIAKKASEIRPDVVFTIKTENKLSGNLDADEFTRIASVKNARRIGGQLEDMGIESNRIKYSFSEALDLKTSRILIFVD